MRLCRLGLSIRVWCFATLLSACAADEWESRVTVGAAWSDDAGRVLVSIHRWEERPLTEPFGAHDMFEERNGTVELWNVATDGSDPILTMPARRGGVLGAFFMRGAEYVLAPYYPDQHVARSESTGDAVYLRINASMATDVVELPWAQHVPAPDGATIARLDYSALPGAPSDVRGVALQLLDGEALSPVGAPVDLEVMAQNARFVWIADDQVAVEVLLPSGAKQLLVVDREGRVSPMPGSLLCETPATTSSPWDSQGRRVEAELSPPGNGFSITVGAPDGLGWPRRCYGGS